MAPKTSVRVPDGRPGDGPHLITGKDVLKVGNWILKGVAKAHHGKPEYLNIFCAWRHFHGAVTVPQYVEDAGDARFGDFSFTLRQVSWQVDDFVRIAMAAIVKENKTDEQEVFAKLPAMMPTFTLVATNGLPSPQPWVNAYEYVFRMVWILPRDGGSAVQIEKDLGRANDDGVDSWSAAQSMGHEIVYFDVKPSRDGSLSWSSHMDSARRLQISIVLVLRTLIQKIAMDIFGNDAASLGQFDRVLPDPALAAEITALQPRCEIGSCTKRPVGAYCNVCKLPACKQCYDVYLGIAICGDCDPHDGNVCFAEEQRNCFPDEGTLPFAQRSRGLCVGCRAVRIRILQFLLRRA